jgi:hypothetical protein
MVGSGLGLELVLGFRQELGPGIVSDGDYE